jgi:hypothetical protein
MGVDLSGVRGGHGGGGEGGDGGGPERGSRRRGRGHGLQLALNSCRDLPSLLVCQFLCLPVAHVL